jgi:hypothetical protein
MTCNAANGFGMSEAGRILFALAITALITIAAYYAILWLPGMRG